MSNKVCLIGASGFVGTRLIEITNEEFSVKNFDKNQSHFYKEITSIGDVRNQHELDASLAGMDTIVLLAAEHRDDVSPVSLYYDVNVQGTRNVLNAMDKNGVILFLPVQLLSMGLTRKILQKAIRRIHLIITEKVSGKLKKCCVNGLMKRLLNVHLQ